MPSFQSWDPIEPSTAPPLPAGNNTRSTPNNRRNGIIDAIAETNIVESSEGQDFILDVYSDHRFPLSSWIYSISRANLTSQYLTAINASPSSLVGYTYAMYIGMLYMNDARIQSTSSKYARDTMQDANARMVFDMLLDFPVPSFAEMEFEALRYYQHDTASNLITLGSCAGFSFAHVFGRFFTVGTFFSLHDLIARSAEDTPLSDLQSSYSRTPIASIRDNNNIIHITPAHLFGNLLNDSPYSNWFNSRLNVLLNTAEIRSMSSRPGAGSVPIFALPTSNSENINPYLFMMSISDDNVGSLLSWICNLSAFTLEAFPLSKPLRNYLQAGDPEVLRHLVFEMPPPNCHATPTTIPASTVTSTDDHNPFRIACPPKSHLKFAAAIEFRSTHTNAVPTVTTFGHQTAAIGTIPDGSWSPEVVSDAAFPQGNDAHTFRLVTDDTWLASTPQATIFDPIPQIGSPTHHIAVITSGKVIESGDISGTFVPNVHPRRNLFCQNTHYLAGAIAINSIRPSFPTAPLSIKNVDSQQLKTIPRGFTRGDSTHVTVPQFPPGIVVPASNAQGLTNASSIMLLNHLQRHCSPRLSVRRGRNKRLPDPSGYSAQHQHELHPALDELPASRYLESDLVLASLLAANLWNASPYILDGPSIHENTQLTKLLISDIHITISPSHSSLARDTIFASSV